MATQHKDITEGNIHEPKGASTASSGTVYVSNGSGSGVWALPNPKGSDTAAAGTSFVSDGAGSGSWLKNPFGFIYFENIGSPIAHPATTSFSRIGDETPTPLTTTAPGVSHLVTEGTNCKLTYLGPTNVLDIYADLSVDQAAGANRDLTFSLHKNGVIIPGSTAIITAQSGDKRHITVSAATVMNTNDYFDIYCKISTAGTINIYTLSFYIDPH